MIQKLVGASGNVVGWVSCLYIRSCNYHIQLIGAMRLKSLRYTSQHLISSTISYTIRGYGDAAQEPEIHAHAAYREAGVVGYLRP